VVAEEHGSGGLGESVFVGKGEQQGKVGIRAPIGEVQAQFLIHRRRGRVCRGSDGGKLEGRVW
jgi:hypothetical protein